MVACDLQPAREHARPLTVLIYATLVGSEYKSGDCQGFKTRIFESGTSIFVKRLPAAIGK